MSPDQPAPEPLAARHLRLLAELTDMAMDLTRATHTRATEEIAATGHPAPETTREFARLSRAVRQTVALEARIAQSPGAQASPNPAAPPPIDPRRNRIAAELRAAARKTPQRDRKALDRHIDERLDAEDVQDALADNLPLADIIADLARGLGLPFDIGQVPDELLEPSHPGPAFPPEPPWSDVRPLGVPRRKWLALAPDRSRRTGPAPLPHAEKILCHPTHIRKGRAPPH